MFEERKIVVIKLLAKSISDIGVRIYKPINDANVKTKNADGAKRLNLRT